MNSKVRNTLLGTWALGVGLIAFRNFRQGLGWPWPYQFIGVNVAWSMLGALSMASPVLAGAFAGGIDLYLLLQNADTFSGAFSAALPSSKGGSLIATSTSDANYTPGQTGSAVGSQVGPILRSLGGSPSVSPVREILGHVAIRQTHTAAAGSPSPVTSSRRGGLIAS